MARVTDTEVKTILETSIDTTPFITTANIIVTDRLSGEGLDADLLAQIELYLSAHLATFRDPRIKTEQIGAQQARAEYQMIAIGTGLDSTSYGQMVKMLDTTGIMATIGKKKVIFKALPIVT